MKVRTDAWHYKVFMWSHLVPADTERNKDYPVSLCPYFWRVFLALLWLPPIALLCFVGKIFWIPLSVIEYYLGLSSALVTRKDLHLFAVVYYGKSHSPVLEGFAGTSFLLSVIFLVFSVVQQWMQVCLLICQMAVVISIGVFSILAVFIFWDKMPWNKIQSMAKPGSSLVWSYLSAVKQKVCPQIEFVDKD